MLKKIQKINVKSKMILDNEKGELSALAWTLGSGVVVVLIIVLLMTLAPNTVATLWNSFVTYAKGAFGI